jgi:hypothetical protein
MARKDPFLVMRLVLNEERWALYERVDTDEGERKYFISGHATRDEAREAKRQLMKEEPHGL